MPDLEAGLVCRVGNPFRGELEGRVAHNVHLQIWGEAVDIANGITLGREAKEFVGPLVLEHVHRTAPCHKRTALLKNVFIGNAIGHIERTVVAGVHYHNLCLRPEGAKIIQGKVVFFLNLEVLCVKVTVMVQYGYVQLRPHQFVLDAGLERIIVFVVHIGKGVGKGPHPREMLPQGHLFVHMRQFALGNAAGAVEHKDVVQPVGILVSACSLQQIGTELVVSGRSLCIGGTDASAEDIGGQRDFASGGKRIVEIRIPVCVFVYIFELQVKVIVITVGRHT